MKNPREQRQANYLHLMSLSRAYLLLARRWYYSPKYTLDEKYRMCLEADAMAEAIRLEALALVLS